MNSRFKKLNTRFKIGFSFLAIFIVLLVPSLGMACSNHVYIVKPAARNAIFEDNTPDVDYMLSYNWSDSVINNLLVDPVSKLPTEFLMNYNKVYDSNGNLSPLLNSALYGDDNLTVRNSWVTYNPDLGGITVYWVFSASTHPIMLKFKTVTANGKTVCMPYCLKSADIGRKVAKYYYFTIPVDYPYCPADEDMWWNVKSGNLPYGASESDINFDLYASNLKGNNLGFLPGNLIYVSPEKLSGYIFYRDVSNMTFFKQTASGYTPPSPISFGNITLSSSNFVYGTYNPITVTIPYSGGTDSDIDKLSDYSLSCSALIPGSKQIQVNTTQRDYVNPVVDKSSRQLRFTFNVDFSYCPTDKTSYDAETYYSMLMTLYNSSGVTVKVGSFDSLTYERTYFPDSGIDISDTVDILRVFMGSLQTTIAFLPTFLAMFGLFLPTEVYVLFTTTCVISIIIALLKIVRG